MFEYDRCPSWPRDDWIEQGQQAALRIKDRQLHRQRVGLSDLHAGRGVVAQPLAMRVVQRSGFDQQTAHDSARPSLSHELFVERVDGVRWSRKFQILVFYIGQ